MTAIVQSITRYVRSLVEPVPPESARYFVLRFTDVPSELLAQCHDILRRGSVARVDVLSDAASASLTADVVTRQGMRFTNGLRLMIKENIVWSSADEYALLQAGVIKDLENLGAWAANVKVHTCFSQASSSFDAT